MINSVAVLSDIHGVLPALEAVLAEPAVQTADVVVVTGDHASGPQPRQVLDRLRAEGDRVLLVRGNADRELVDLSRGETLDVDEISRWAAAQLTPADLALLDALPHPLTLTVAGFGEVVFCHGSPRRDDELVLVDSPLWRWFDALSELNHDQQTVVCGHTHMPFLRLVDRRLVVNPASVGMPYGRAGAHWALLDRGAVSLRRSDLDATAAIAAVTADSGFPGRAEWAEEYLRAVNSDVDALQAFTPVADRRPTDHQV